MSSKKNKKPTLNYSIYRLSVISSVVLFITMCLMLYVSFIAPINMGVAEVCRGATVKGGVIYEGDVACMTRNFKIEQEVRNNVMLPFKGLAILLSASVVMNVLIANKSLKLHSLHQK